jgi:hypothetical protein
MRSRNCDAIDPGRDAAALGADVGQDALHSRSPEHHHDCQYHDELWNFRSFLIEQHTFLHEPI